MTPRKRRPNLRDALLAFAQPELDWKSIVKRYVSALLALIVGTSGVVFAIAPAQAVPQIFSVDCASGGSTQSVTAVTGDTITLTVSAGTCAYVSVEKSIIASSSAVSISGGGSPSAVDRTVYWEWVGTGAITQVDITLSITGAGQINFNSGTPSYTGQTFNVSSGGDSSSNGATSSVPAPVFQQFGRPTSGTCDAVAPESLNWSGVASGGWSESWAQWMNGGTGGAVCTRELVYSTARGGWVVN